MSGLEPEQKQAELLRTLYKLRLVDIETLTRIIDQLQIQLFERYLKSKDQPDQP